MSETIQKEKDNIGVYVIGGRYIIGNTYLTINNIKYIENSLGLILLEGGKLAFIPVAIGAINNSIELNYNNIEFYYVPNEEIIKFYKETVKNMAEVEAKERAKKAGIILNDKKVLNISKRGINDNQ